MTSIPLPTLHDLALTAVSPGGASRALRLMTGDGYTAWQEMASAEETGWIEAMGFSGKAGKALVMPDSSAIGVIGDTAPIWDGAAISAALPPGTWHFSDNSDKDIDRDDVALGWALAQYRYTTYRQTRDGNPDTQSDQARQLVLGPDLAPGSSSGNRLAGLATGTAFCRNLINMPPNHMTPAGLEAAARGLADAFGAAIAVTTGAELAAEFPAINTVGRAAEIAPRLIDLRWGQAGPKITLIGKGITFDSGGLDLKPSKAMELMKKDMGGAAHVLGLAKALMTAEIQIQLRVLIPAAENAVSSESMRPLDVIDTRAGLNVEVGNTDAEGRLVLADAITLACEDEPDFMIDFATLTGAARVALGTELPALFCNHDDTATGILAASGNANDPLWRLPLFEPYETQLDGGFVTLSSTGSSGYGGAITAALFLRRFAGRKTNWAHIDVMAWNLGSKAGRPKGGEAMGLRALFTYIEGLAAG